MAVYFLIGHFKDHEKTPVQRAWDAHAGTIADELGVAVSS